jgi:hypothetical protein
MQNKTAPELKRCRKNISRPPSDYLKKFYYDTVNFDVNALQLAITALAWAPPQPKNVRIGGAVQSSTTLAWDAVEDPNLAGYKIYWRETMAPQWHYSRFVAKATEHTLEHIVIDNYLFGVASVGKDGNESVVVFPSGMIRGRR